MFTLKWLRSIKLKFSIVIVVAIIVAVLMSQVGYALGWPVWLRPVLAAAVSLVFVQFLAHGMTSPLRAMAAAAKAIEQGDHSVRIDTPNVDEVGQLAQAFNAMAAGLADADRQRRELIANVSHELRTPIAGLRATVENVIDGVAVLDASALVSMHGRVDRLGRLIDDLLDLSRLEAGTLVLAHDVLSLREVVAGVVDEHRFDHPSTHVDVNIDDSLTVVGDPDRLHQVFANLLDNATLHGAGPVRIEAVSDNASVRLAMTDQGPGLGADGDRVFERFFRADATRAAGHDGVGLGLAIARWIVELHGGSIHAEPNEPAGARFVVLLPKTADVSSG